jgi:hypothetical protein
MKLVNQKYYPYLISIILIYSAGWQSCAVLRSNARTEVDIETMTATPKIIFLNYSVKPGKSKGDPEIKLINKGISEGRIKLNNSNPDISKPGDLICVSLDNRMGSVDSIIISDPLNITVESVDDNNALFKKEIALDSSQFFIRMQLSEKTDAIAIRKRFNSNNQISYLLVTKII